MLPPEPRRTRRRPAARASASCGSRCWASGVVVAGAAYGAYYFTYGQYHESTDDAYVNGNLVQLTPQVTGTVNAVDTDDTQIVKVGDPVVTLDPADSRIALLNAEAALGQAVRQVSTLYVNNDYYAANIAQRASDLARAQDDLKRRVAVPEHRRGIGGRRLARPRRRGRRSGRARRRSPAGAIEPCADRPHVGRKPSGRASRRREGPRRLPQLRAQYAAGAGDGLRRAALGASGRARRTGHAADVDRAARRRVDRRELQGSATAADAHRSAGHDDGGYLRFERQVPRAGDRFLGGHGQRVRDAAGTERDRQLDQDRAALAGAYRPRPEGAGGASASYRAVDGWSTPTRATSPARSSALL